MSFFKLLLIAASVFAFSVFENASAAENCREVQASFNEKTSEDVSACVGQLFLRDVDATPESVDSELHGKYRYAEQIENHGYSKGNYWLRFSLQRASPQVEEVFVSLDNPLAASVIAFQKDAMGEWRKSAIAEPSTYPAGGQLSGRDLTVRIPFSGKEKIDLLIKASAFSQNYAVIVRGTQAHAASLRIEQLLFGAYYGIILAMALYNFWLFFGTRDITFLFYSATIVAFHGFYLPTLAGGPRVVFPEFPVQAMTHLPFSTAVGFAFAVLFALSFSNSFRTHPRLSKFCIGCVAVFPLQWIVAVQSVTMTWMFFVPFYWSALILAIFITVQKALAGERPARIFLVAWGLMFFGYVYWWLGQLGVTQHTNFSQHSMLIGSVVEVILFSVALGDKFKSLSAEKESALKREIDSYIENEKIRSIMGKYMSKEVAQRILADKEHELGGEQCDLVLFFTDVRGFTSISERCTAPELVEKLNRDLEIVVTHLQAEGAVIDKFIGDACLAYFDPQTCASPASAALRAATRIVRDSKATFPSGIGLHFGKVVAGNIGSPNRLEYTIIGDAVNTVTRIESATRSKNADLLFSDDFLQQLRKEGCDSSYTDLGTASLKGKEASVRLWSLDEFCVSPSQ